MPFNSNTTGIKSGAESAYPSGKPAFDKGYFVGFLLLDRQSSVQCFVGCCLFICPMFCLSFELRTRALVSSNSSNLRSVGFYHFPRPFAGTVQYPMAYIYIYILLIVAIISHTSFLFIYRGEERQPNEGHYISTRTIPPQYNYVNKNIYVQNRDVFICRLS